MAIQGIESALQQIQKMSQTASGTASGVIETPTGGGFAAQFSAALDKISDTQTQTSDKAQALASGTSSLGLNDVMVDMQKSSISLQTGVQVRNKMVAAYQDIMNMSV